MKSRGLVSALAAFCIAGAIAPAAETPAGPISLADAVTSAIRSAGIAVPQHAPAPSGLPAFSLTTAASVAPEEGRRGTVTESEELAFDLRPGIAFKGASNAAKARFSQAVADARQAQRGLIGDAIAAFFAVAADQSDLAAAGETVDLAQRSLFAATGRHRAGTAPAVDVERARIALDEAQADRAAAQAALSGDSEALLQLTSRASLNGGVEMPASAAALPDAYAVRRAAIATDPRVAAAESALSASQAEAMLARADLLPGLTVAAGVGRSVVSDAQVVGPAGSVSLGIPVGGGTARAGVAAADAAVQAARATLTQSRTEVEQQALRALTEARSAQARIPRLADAYARAQRVAAAELQAYRIGAVGSVDVLSAQSQLSAARTALNAARVAAARSAAMLQMSMGEFDR